MQIDALMSRASIMAIFRNLEPGTAVGLATRAWDLGIELVEVTVQVPSELATLDAVLQAAAERGKAVGAGTVTSVEQLAEVRKRPVAFTVAPGLSAEVVRLSEEMGLPHLPGVSTPTEIQRATELGCSWLKAFPATVLGPEWFRAMRGPFPGVSFVATGGVDATNAHQFFAAGARTVAVGSALADPRQVDLLAELLSGSGESGDQPA